MRGYLVSGQIISIYVTFPYPWFLHMFKFVQLCEKVYKRWGEALLIRILNLTQVGLFS